ncbi:MAG: protein disulfide isomerase family protein [Syntrophales bacterium]
MPASGDLNDKQFDEFRKNTTGKFIALFHATYCRYCKGFMPVWEAKVKSIPDATFARVDITDDNSTCWIEFGITAVPTLILFDNGKPVEKTISTPVNVVNEKDIDSMIAKCRLTRQSVTSLSS